MKSLSPEVLLGVSALSIATFAVGWTLAPDAVGKIHLEPDVEPNGRLQPRERRTRVGTGVAAKMNRIRNAGSPVERSRAAISLAMSIDPSEFAGWVEGDFSARNGPELSIFRMILFERWAAEAPDSLIAWGVENDYGQAGRALDTFAKHDPERLINYFREHPNDELELSQLRDIGKSHPALALARLREMYAEGGVAKPGRGIRDVLLALSENSTGELEAALGSLPESIRGEAQSVLTGRKLAKDFNGEVRKLFSDPNGWEYLSGNMDLLKDRTPEMLKAVPDMPESWKAKFAGNPWRLFRNGGGREWLGADLVALGFSEKQADQIRTNAFSYLAYSSPDEVLKNVSDAVRDRNAIGSSLGRLFERGPDGETKARELISRMTEPEVKRVAMAQLEELAEARDNPAPSSSMELFNELGTVDAGSVRARKMASQVARLKTGEIREYRAGFEGLSAGMKDQASLAILKSPMNTDSMNPVHGDAIRHLAANPPQPEPAGTRERFDLSESAVKYTFSVARQDPVAASRWVDSLPVGSTRSWTVKNLAAYWSQYDPAASSAWMETLSAEDRAQAVEHMENPW